MNAPIGNKNRPWNGRVTVINAESSSNILTGQPVCDPVNLVHEGYGAVLPATAAAARANSFCRGIAVPADGTAEPGTWFDVVNVGFCNFTRLVRGTRAASTDAWPTFPAIGVGDVLTIASAANAVSYSTTGAPYQGGAAIACMGVTGATASSALSAASVSTAASDAYTAFAGQTAYTVGIRTWLRLL